VIEMLENHMLDDNCKLALNKYGGDLQLTIGIEECSELIKAISKIKRYTSNPELDNTIPKGMINNIVDEIADVHIMLRQIEIIFDIEYYVNEQEKFKLERIKPRLNNKGLLE
jgi:NTP pyrophosphatase (non-canonical NTP hydrolase)